ncbi:hypothetical protein EDB83DRAFT_2323788 [Lactarius deliciosus]|nr:hypothetical protein EDB83DRAFT_2323788 [Lactarius deliciosus]
MTTVHGTFYKKGDRASPAFVPTVLQDLITLTLEILAQDLVAKVGRPTAKHPLTHIQAESFKMVKPTLEPVPQSFRLRAVKVPKPHNGTSPLRVPVPPRIMPATAATTVRLDAPVPAARAGFAQRSSPQSIEVIPSL